jgi:hypothetical protein
MDQQEHRDCWGSECVEISFDMYHDRKENKNVGTFVFVQLHVISQHCMRHFKSHDFSFKLHSCHNHKCCPTSDVSSLPCKRISPIKERFGNGNIFSLSARCFSTSKLDTLVPAS